MTENKDDPFSELFATEESAYGDKYRDHILEQYRLYVEMAEKTSERRSTANNFFLSVNGFLLSIIGILPQVGGISTDFSLVWMSGIVAAGIIFCFAWMTIIRSYKKLNEAKFTIIGRLEKKLPLALFDSEWKYLTTGKKKKRRFGVMIRYFPLTLIESWVPGTCIALYIGLLFGAYLVFSKLLVVVQ